MKARLAHLEEKRQSEFSGSAIAEGETQCKLDMSKVPKTSELWSVNEKLEK